MIPWEQLDSAAVPRSRSQLTLYRRGDEYSIQVDGEELMNSHVHCSEEALGRIACTRVAGRSAARILVGGLGMGFTLRAALVHLRADAQVTLAELAPAVVRWNREYLGNLAGCPLDDERVTVHEGDVAELIAADALAWDAIILDVDNGPEGFTRGENDRLYGRSGLAVAGRALRPGGVLAVWSASPSRSFVQRLQRCGFAVESYRVPSRPSGGGTNTIWIARPRAPSTPLHRA
jgi:spermidine synthase